MYSKGNNKPINRMKIQASDWEKIVNEATNKGLTQNIQAARALQ